LCFEQALAPMDNNLPRQQRPKSQAQLEHHHRTHKRRKLVKAGLGTPPTGNSASPTPTPTPTPTQQPRATSSTTPRGCDSDDDMPDLLWLNQDQADLDQISSNPTCPLVYEHEPDPRRVYPNIHAANHQCLVEGIVALANLVASQYSPQPIQIANTGPLRTTHHPSRQHSLVNH
jgi:hypothetical protein